MTKAGKACVGLLALATGFMGGAWTEGAAQAAREANAGVPRYTVVDTQGYNLLVTDNTTNRLFYYTIDKEKPVGTDLKLRATVDLNQVGQQTIKPIESQPPHGM